MGKSLLILGNGFDLAHGLPTRYSDFLEFCNILKNLSKFRNDKALFMSTNIENKKINKGIIGFFNNEFDNRTNYSEGKWVLKNKNANELLSLLDNNIWYDYLFGLYENNKLKGENWIDFESEICYIIRIIDKHTENLSHSYEYLTSLFGNTPESNDIDFVDKYHNFHKTISKYFDNKNSIKNLRKLLYNDLKRLTYALELYLSIALNYSKYLLLSPDILTIKPNHVINFNYTDTYERLYDSTANVYHIHGAVKESPNINENNMVLGIDEYWSDEEKDNHTNFAIFKKFAQRIQKRTGQDYKKIHDDFVTYFDVESIKNHAKGIDKEKYKPNIYIFGHSLDVTDKDILKLFLDEDSFKVTIFCRDEETEGEYIANVIKIIGEDKLIKKVNTYPPQIEFVIQQEMKAYEEITTEQEKNALFND